MVRILKHFGTSYPCSAPLHLVAHKQAHASTVLRGICEIRHCVTEPCPSAAQRAAARELHAQLLSKIPRSLEYALVLPRRVQIPVELRSTAEEKAKTATPRLQEAIVDFKTFQQWAM